MRFSNKKQDKIEIIEPDLISFSPFQPRTVYDSAKMDGLVQSIRKNGIIQPLGVRQTDKNKYELLFGHRRLIAARMLKLQGVPCIVTTATDQNSFIYALIENIQREKLGFIEEARAIARLIEEFHLTQSEASLKLGMSQPTIANKLRILKLTKKQMERIENFCLTERHARALLRIPDDTRRDDALNEIVVRGLNVEQTDKFIDKFLTPAQKESKSTVDKLVVNDLRFFVNSINKAIKVMKTSGIKAKTSKQEDENYIKYTVTIAKK